MDILLVYITFKDRASASTMIDLLIDKKLIACGNIMPIESCYFWQGSKVREGEYVAIMKSMPTLKHDIESEVVNNHSYEVPCIITWLAEANLAYGKWVAEQVKYLNH